MIFDSPMPRAMVYGGLAKYGHLLRESLAVSREKSEVVNEFERKVLRLTGARHGIAMPQARVGIYHVLQALVRRGGKVIMSPYTIYDVVNMVIAAGAVPVFADIDERTLNVEPREVERLIDDSTDVVLVTHLHGISCDVKAIKALCDKNRIALVEDAAQAFGAHVDGQWLGTFGTAGIFSFGMAKNVNSFFGGMVVTNDDSLAEEVRVRVEGAPPMEGRRLRSRAVFCGVGELLTAWPIFQLVTYWIFRYGYLHNVEALNKRWRGEDEPKRKERVPESYLRRMNAAQAQILSAQVESVGPNNRERIRNAKMYYEGLRDVPECVIPPYKEDGSHIYLAYPIQVADRHAVLRDLMRKGRDLTVQHIGNNADYEVFKDYHRNCPNSRKAAERTLLLPTYPGYGDKEIERNIKGIREYFGR